MVFNYPDTPRRRLSEDQEFDQYYALYLKGLASEKGGDPDKALDIYLYILRNYLPLGTVYYSRPAILFERKGEFSLAIQICKQAIKVHYSRKGANLAPEEFEHRIKRLERKLLTKSIKK